MGLFTKKITVEFINEADGSIIGKSKVPIDQLPETFQIATTMDLGEDKWSVVSATPPNKSEFSKSKSLILKMNKVEMMNPNDINFSLPTISAELPAVVETGLFSGDAFNLREDDWRQNEFLPKSSLDKIEIEVTSIKEIWENHSKQIDENFSIFSKMHVRDSIGIPSVNISLYELSKVLETDQITNLTLGSEINYVQDGFSLSLGTHTIYGTVQNDIIQSLCVDAINEDSEITIQKIHSTFDLVFVNWYYHSILN